MTMQHIAPKQAKAMIDDGALLVDIREENERRRTSIPGSHSMPLSRLAPLPADARAAGVVVFHCKSGMRTRANAAALGDAAGCTTYVLDGGIDAWAAAGLPVTVDRAQPIEISRQVQLTAGSLALAGTVLGATLSPAWYTLPAIIGAGLMVAGATGWCGMAKVLAAMPWNRVSPSKVA